MTEEEIKQRSNPKNINEIAKLNFQENIEFQEYVVQVNSSELDSIIFQIQQEVTNTINCTYCGNCCKSLMINVETEDKIRLANHLKISEKEFDEKYIEKSNSGHLSIMSKIPCHFLDENKCTVYEARPTECRNFPGLDLPHFSNRLFAFFIHYEKCPIVFYSIEKLKTKFNFK